MRLRIFILRTLFAVAATIPMFYVNANAATVGNWSKTCIAPNWMTGVPEPVPDMNVNNPAVPFWGFTSKQPGGHWLTQYNYAKIFGPASTPNVLIFLFYHECAHAQFNSADEAVADCGGLNAMKQDMAVTSSMIAEITAAYNSVGRPFPSGACP